MEPVAITDLDGSALIAGGQVNGGCYGDMPSLVEAEQSEGDTQFQ